MTNLLPVVGPEVITGSVMLAVFSALLLMALGGAAFVALIVRFSRERPPWPWLLQRTARRPWSGWEASFLVLFVFVFQIAFWLCMALRQAAFGADGAAAGALAPLMAQTFVFHGAGFLFISVLIRTRDLSWEQAFGLTRGRIARQAGLGVLFYLAAMPLVAVSAILYRLSLLALHVEVKSQEAVRLFVSPDYPLAAKIFVAVVAVTVAPFVEEALFRGIALPCFLKHARPKLAVVAVSMLFAAIHFNLASVVPLFVIAMAFAVAYVYSGTLLVPVVMHVLFNTVSLAALFLLRDVPGLAWLR